MAVDLTNASALMKPMLGKAAKLAKIKKAKEVKVKAKVSVKTK
jgi:hypothetical protein